MSQSLVESSTAKAEQASSYSLKDSHKSHTIPELSTENDEKPHCFHSQLPINNDTTYSINPEINSDALISSTTHDRPVRRN